MSLPKGGICGLDATISLPGYLLITWLYNQIMVGKIFQIISLIGFLAAISACSSVEAAPTEPVTMVPSPTIQALMNTTKPGQTASELPTPTATQFIPAPIRVDNIDGSWYLEYFEYDSDEVSIYKSGLSEPVLVIDQLAYYLDRQADLEAIEDTQSPIMARWYDPLWSPDGRYVAIVGAIEGPTSDLYVFDTQAQRFQRLTSGENQAIEPIWSPDSRWILHGEMFDGFGSDGYVGYWAARVDGSEVILLFTPGGWVEFLFWADKSRFYVADSTILGYVALRYIDLSTAQITTVFDVKKYEVCCGVPSTFAIDPLNKSLTYMLTGNFDNTPYQEGGIYTSTAAEPRQKLVDTFPSSNTYGYSLIDDFGDFVVKPQCEDNTALIYVVVSGGSTYCLTEQD